MKKLLYIIFILVFILACDSGGGGNKSSHNSDDNDTEIVIDNPVIDTENPPEIVVDNPDTIEDNNPVIDEQEENIIMGTLLFYDGSLKNYDGEIITKLFDCDSCIKVDDYFFTDLEIVNINNEKLFDIPEIAVKAKKYNDRIFYYTVNRNLYYINITTGENIFVAHNQYSNHDCSMDDTGIRFVLYFFDSEGIMSSGQFVGYENIIKLIKPVDNVYEKYYYSGGNFIQVGRGTYSNFVQPHSLDINGKIYYTNGAIFDKENLKLTEPTFSITLSKFVGGSAFTRYMQPSRVVGGVETNIYGKPHIIGVGVYDNKGIFLNAKDGKLYIFNPDTDTLTEWLQIVNGTGNDDKPESFALFEKTSAYIYDEFIIYFDGEKIQKLNIITGVKSEIANATYFKGFN